ncbi:unnamed protein product [Lactuca virosa]|uniref:Uncharacterized protein n=1 Tax=Lactuca virosa TaxID=75947 RepID=A0AAU9N1U1_9ASTR|nr:unnamed protein product [Lactuca virosa]
MYRVLHQHPPSSSTASLLPPTTTLPLSTTTTFIEDPPMIDRLNNVVVASFVPLEVPCPNKSARGLIAPVSEPEDDSMFGSSSTIRSIQSLSDLDDERLYLIDQRYMWIGLSFSDRPPTEMAPLFPGCDYEHIIVMDKPDSEGTTNQQMIDCYVETESKFLGRVHMAFFNKASGILRQVAASKHINHQISISEGKTIQKIVPSSYNNESNETLKSDCSELEVVHVVGTSMGLLYCRLVPLVLLLVDGNIFTSNQ